MHSTLQETLPKPAIKWYSHLQHNDDVTDPPHKSTTREVGSHTDKTVLVISETSSSSPESQIVKLLQANRIKFQVAPLANSLPDLTRTGSGKYSVIIFENLEHYIKLDKGNGQLLNTYCQKYAVGVIAFASPTETALLKAEVKGFPLYVHTNLAMKDYELNPRSEVLRIAKPGKVDSGFLPGDDWTVFLPNHKTYKPVSFAKTQTGEMINHTDITGGNRYCTTVQDRGLYDGIERVIFGNGLKYWIHSVLLLDALSYLSHGKIRMPLRRYIQVDIDDVFLTGLRTQDVKVSDSNIGVKMHACNCNTKNC